MPLNKRRFRKKRFFKKRSSRTWKVAKAAARSVLKRNLELKAFDSYEDVSAGAASGVNRCWSQITTGTAYNNRIGDIVVAKGLQLTLRSEASDTFNVCRYVFYIWKGDDGADTPQVAEIINTSALTGVNTPYNSLVYDERKFKILLDVMHVVDASLDNQLKVTRHYIPLRNHKIKFGSGTTTGVGHIYCLRISDSTAAPDPSMLVNARLFYTDA